MMHFLARCARRLHAEHLLYKMYYPLTHGAGHMTGHEVEAAIQRLEQLHPDPNHSALTHNTIDGEPEYDLQIVVPAYNAGAYIKECMDTLTRQDTSHRLLVTVVNDGSTDNTGALLSAYEGQQGVEVITQRNLGHAGARNTALRHIKAQYVMFVDADDRIPPQAAEVLLDTAYRTGADIVEGNYCQFEGTRITYTSGHGTWVGTDYSRLHGLPCGKVYRARLFAQTAFPLDYWFEDTICPYLIYPQCQRVATIPHLVYEYRTHSGSISHTSRGRLKTIDALWVTRRILKDSTLLGIARTPQFYDDFLQDICINASRFIYLKEEVRRDLFAATCRLTEQEFGGYDTRKARFRPLERALRLYDYKGYLLYCRCFLGL